MTFEVRTVVGSSFDFIVSSVSFESPFESADELEKKLRSLTRGNSTKRVLVDLLCSNGFEWNRFATYSFNNSRFGNDIEVINEDDVPLSLLVAQEKFYKSHPEYLTSSILTPTQISHFLQ